MTNNMHAATLSSRFNIIIVVVIFVIETIFDIAVAQHASIFVHVVDFGHFVIRVDSCLGRIYLCRDPGRTLSVPFVQCPSRMARTRSQVGSRRILEGSRMERTGRDGGKPQLFLGLEGTPGHGNASLAAAAVVTMAKAAAAATSSFLVMVNDKVWWRKW